MSQIDELLAKVASDDVFRAALENDPAAALQGTNLTDDDLAQLDAAVRQPGGSLSQYFTSSNPRQAGGH
ncbi:MAG: hypothetical protein R2754_02575 [Microthrixaceae bacterium]